MNREKEIRLLNFFSAEELEKLHSKKVLIIGLGGVGGLVSEALVRTGIANLDIVDGDKVEKSNFNRQIIAIDENIGLNKTTALSNRLKQIDTDLNIKEYPIFINEETIRQFNFSAYDLVLDCIDDVKAKILIIGKCKKQGTEIISCMGTANKTDPNRFRIVDINQTSYCPLAKKVRSELRKKNIQNVKVCFSDEIPLLNQKILGSQMFIVGSASFVIAKEAIDYLIR